ncbi:MAG: hypothetical protein ACAF41_25760 [Leptolyngbya sp. BL-A-14]
MRTIKPLLLTGGRAAPTHRWKRQSEAGVKDGPRALPLLQRIGKKQRLDGGTL